MTRVDLHTHSNKSDGSLSPSELLDEAKRVGLSAIALTDHDTIDGLDEAITHGNNIGVRVIPGVELSTEYMGRDVHIVGLFIDYTNDRFLKHLEHFITARDDRNRKMCQKLTDAGIPVIYEELLEMFGDSVLTRAHFARYMLSKGYIKSLSEAFERYIGDHCPYFIPRKMVTPKEGIEIILQAGGIPILAHPILYKLGKETLEKLVYELKGYGLIGIEAIYSTYTNADERNIRDLANKYDLLISGGSDFHGIAKPGLNLGTGYGKLAVPETVLKEIETYYIQRMNK